MALTQTHNIILEREVLVKELNDLRFVLSKKRAWSLTPLLYSLFVAPSLQNSIILVHLSHILINNY